ncbi:MAG: hypothetical protein K1X94_02065 [Sandaracinaceae bacterium]|nr:hypothetical protein [Sandaracinaceae bacterium]
MAARSLALSTLVSPVPSVRVRPVREVITPAAPAAPRARLAKLGLAATVLTLLVAIFAASLIGPFIMFATPLLLVLGSALGPLHALVRGEL